jgi:hypothetical protein
MPTESDYDKPNKLIYNRYWGDLTGKEFAASLAGEPEFFDQMTGIVTVIFELYGLKELPPSMLRLASTAHFAHYKPLVMVFIGANPLFQAMGHTFSYITQTSLYNFDTLEEATAFMNTHQTDPTQSR